MPSRIRRLKHLLDRRRFERELAEEMETHRVMTERRLRDDGMSAADAAAASRRVMGNATLAREEVRAIWTSTWLESLVQDLKYALRMLFAQPQFTVVACGTLAAAIGLNTSLFTAYNAMAWRPWAVPDTERVYNVGIRMALGAREAQVVQLVLGSSGRAIAIGLAFGVAGALAVSSLLRNSLYGLSMVDPIAYLSVGLLLVAASLAATVLPARRASRVNPIEALRCE